MARPAFYTAVGVAVIIYGIVAWQVWLRSIPAEAQIDILDVGQGDAIHIRTRTGDDILIDGGPDAMVVQRLGEVMPFWDRTIELMISTHPDADHITGLVSVLNYYTVERVAYEPLPQRTATQKFFYNTVAAKHIPVLTLQAGDYLQFNDQEDMAILYPTADTDFVGLPTNDTSITALYTFHGAVTTRFLTMGDMSSTIEDQLAEQGVFPNIDIQKVSHHGSKYSSSTDFLQVVDPELALISVGQDNPYGHPTAAALSRLSQFAQIYRTDQLGTITVDVSDEGYVVE